jgi:hypothetical protein
MGFMVNFIPQFMGLCNKCSGHPEVKVLQPVSIIRLFCAVNIFASPNEEWDFVGKRVAIMQ